MHATQTIDPLEARSGKPRPMESFTREAGRCNEKHLVRVYRCSQFRNHTAKGEGFQICLAGYFDASRLGVPGVDCQ